jgi:hypothetical protein
MKSDTVHVGSDWRYKKGCRCEECRKAHAEYEKKMKALRKKEKAGLLVRQKQLVKIDEVRNHVRFLHSHNVGARSIGAATGISFTTVYEIGWGSRKYCTKKVGDKILALGIKKVYRHQLTDTEKVKQMLEEMKSKGYKKWQIGMMLGYKNGHFNIYKKMQSQNYTRFVQLHQKICLEDKTHDQTTNVPRHQLLRSSTATH